MKNTEYVGYKTGTPVDFELLDKVCKYLNEDKDNFLNTSIEFDSAELAKQQSNAKRSVKELYNWLDENFTEYTPITNSIYKQIINYIN